MNKIDKYIEMLLEANKKMNLSGADTYDEVLNRHVNDSLALLSFVEIHKGMKVLDMGTGAGFPGIPLAIKTEAHFTLVDSLKKRINFLKEVSDNLELENVDFSDLRAEEFCRKEEYRESFDVALSRAVAPLNLLLEYTVPSLKIGGKFFAYKSTNIEEELEKSKNAIEVLGVEHRATHIYELDLDNREKIELSLLKFVKVKKADDRYPRRTGIPAKRPL